MRDDRRKRVPFQREDTAFEENFVLGIEKVVELWVFGPGFSETA